MQTAAALFVELGAPAAPGSHSWTLERCRCVPIADLLAEPVEGSHPLHAPRCNARDLVHQLGQGWSCEQTLVSPMFCGCVYRHHISHVSNPLICPFTSHVLIWPPTLENRRHRGITASAETLLSRLARGGTLPRSPSAMTTIM